MTLQNFTLGTFAQGAAGGATAFESIASATGTGSSAEITFSSIPSTYQHLQIRYLARGDGAINGQAGLSLRFNGVTSSNYVTHGIRGSGSAVSGYGSATQQYLELQDAVLRGGATANCFSVGVIDIHNYASTTQYKTIRSIYGCDSNSVNGSIGLQSGSLFSTTNAISSITVLITVGNFTNTSTFALYGIKGA